MLRSSPAVGGETPLDVVIKESAPLRLAASWMTAAQLAPEHIGPVFLALAPKLTEHLRRSNAHPGTLVHFYDRGPHGSFVVHVGYDIGVQPVPARDGIEIVELPVAKVASTVHRAGMAGIVGVYELLMTWIEQNGYRRKGYSRELYHEMDAAGPRITEIQIPIAD